MKPVNIKSGYTDSLAQKRRARVLLKLILFILMALVVLAAIIYILFFSKVLEVRSITLNGLTQIDSSEIQSQIDERLNQKIFKLIPRKNNLLFLNSDKFKNEILAKYPVLNSMEIKKDIPHDLTFNFTERTALGVWCFKQNCFYFDANGNTWGQAIRSSGFLITVIGDNRDLEEPKIDKEYLEAIKIFLNKEITAPVKGINISADSFRDFKVLTSESYYLMFSLDSDIKKQLELLNIFLNEKKGKGQFQPQYIDLRIDGRVYYK